MGDFVEVMFIRDRNKNGTWFGANNKLGENYRETSLNWVYLSDRTFSCYK